MIIKETSHLKSLGIIVRTPANGEAAIQESLKITVKTESVAFKLQLSPLPLSLSHGDPL